MKGKARISSASLRLTAKLLGLLCACRRAGEDVKMDTVSSELTTIIIALHLGLSPLPRPQMKPISWNTAKEEVKTSGEDSVLGSRLGSMTASRQSPYQGAPLRTPIPAPRVDNRLCRVDISRGAGKGEALEPKS